MAHMNYMHLKDMIPLQFDGNFRYSKPLTQCLNSKWKLSPTMILKDTDRRIGYNRYYPWCRFGGDFWLQYITYPRVLVLPFLLTASSPVGSAGCFLFFEVEAKVQGRTRRPTLTRPISLQMAAGHHPHFPRNLGSSLKASGVKSSVPTG